MYMMGKKWSQPGSLIIVVFLAILLLFFILQAPSYIRARNLIIVSTEDSSPSWTMIKTVRNDLAMIDKIGFSSGIDGIQVEDDGGITYLDPITDDLQDEITIFKDSNGNIVEQIREGELYNEMVLTPSGELYLDGKKVG